eukprot:g23145.t1
MLQSSELRRAQMPNQRRHRLLLWGTACAVLFYSISQQAKPCYATSSSPSEVKRRGFAMGVTSLALGLQELPAAVECLNCPSGLSLCTLPETLHLWHRQPPWAKVRAMCLMGEPGFHPVTCLCHALAWHFGLTKRSRLITCKHIRWVAPTGGEPSLSEPGRESQSNTKSTENSWSQHAWCKGDYAGCVKPLYSFGGHMRGMGILPGHVLKLDTKLDQLCEQRGTPSPVDKDIHEISAGWTDGREWAVPTVDEESEHDSPQHGDGGESGTHEQEGSSSEPPATSASPSTSTTCTFTPHPMRANLSFSSGISAGMFAMPPRRDAFGSGCTNFSY